jgi:tetratricopeptide (TPR) repeat protein
LAGVPTGRAKNIHTGTGFLPAGPMPVMPRLPFALIFLVLAPGLVPVRGDSAATPAVDPATGLPRPDAGGTPEAMAALAELVERQKATLADGRAAADASELEDVRPRLQKIVQGYEDLLQKHGDFAAAWAAYGLFLCDPLVEDRRVALALLLKANGLDPDLPVVKNQIGVLMAEEGRVIDALNYFLAASDLAPREPLYHFQIGLVLDEGRDLFLKTKAWSPETIDKTLLDAFARAVRLAPERTDFAYRAAEAYYDLATPRWEEAFAKWTALEDRLEGRVEVQAVRLHRARVLWKQGLAADARELADSVDASELRASREKLLAEFAADDAAEAAGK